MTQVQFTLTEQEILQVLSGDREEAFKMLVKKILDQIMLAESAEQLGANMHPGFPNHHTSIRES